MASPSKATIYEYDTQFGHGTIREQKAAAVRNPQGFEAEIGKIQRIVQTSELKGSKEKTVLCKEVATGRPCPYKKCGFAHSVATYMAVNLLSQPLFKTGPCESDRCKYGAQCRMIHPGDLAQRKLPGGGREWFIAAHKKPLGVAPIYEYDTQLDSSIEEQKAAAVRNPQEFEAEIGKIQQIVRASKQDPKNKTVLCKKVVTGINCPRKECWFAHRVATYMAANLLDWPTFKTDLCEKNICSYGDHCRRIHPGDLAQRELPSGGREWFIAPYIEPRSTTFINMGTINITIAASSRPETAPPPYRSPRKINPLAGTIIGFLGDPSPYQSPGDINPPEDTIGFSADPSLYQTPREINQLQDTIGFSGDPLGVVDFLYRDDEQD